MRVPPVIENQKKKHGFWKSVLPVNKSTKSLDILTDEWVRNFKFYMRIISSEDSGEQLPELLEIY